MDIVEYTEADIDGKMASDAMFAQSASNGVALIHTLDRHYTTLFRMGKGSDWAAQHPIVSMFLNQLVHLNTGKSMDFDSDKYQLVANAAEKFDREKNG